MDRSGVGPAEVQKPLNKQSESESHVRVQSERSALTAALEIKIECDPVRKNTSVDT